MRAEAPLDFISHSPEQTQRLGARLGELLSPGDVILLEGGLGAGKTVFAQGVAMGLGIEEPVTSPTFTLIHEYQGRVPLYHVDLYRIGGAVEAADLGLEDYLYGDGITLIEWPERAAGILPRAYIVVALRPVSETKRGIRMTGASEHYRALLSTFKRNAFGL